jgi:two-component system phosphate regulon sensor histidine kinase PhoR
VKKSVFNWIVIIMSLALVGLIALQTFWLRNEIRVRSDQFDAQVMEVLNRVVAKVEELENLRFVVDRLRTSADSSIIQSGLNDSLSGLLTSIARESAPVQAELTSQTDDSNDLQTQIEKTIGKYREENASVSSNNQELAGIEPSGSFGIRIEKDVRRREVIDLQLRDVYRAAEGDNEPGLEQRVQSRMQRLQTMVQKMTFQIVDPSVPLFKRISQPVLDSILAGEFKAAHLEQPAGYAVVRDRDSSPVFVSPGIDSIRIRESNHRVDLFPNDVLKRGESIVLVFENSGRSLLHGILPMVLLSTVISLIMVAGFTYTVRHVLQQKKLADIKTDFINNMTHEFKTPIATIAIANDSLRNPKVMGSVEKVQYYTGVIGEENRRMLRQVEKVLQMAQIEKGELVLKKEHVLLKDLVSGAVNSQLLSIEGRGGKIRIIWSVSDYSLTADKDHLLNVFVNLIDNANKYSPDAPDITVEAVEADGHLQIKVTDRGIGMTADEKRRVFETFYRAASGNVHDVKGFGLGLSYAKAIVEAHNGKIELSSEPGKGSTFIVSWTLKQLNGTHGSEYPAG